MRLYTMYWKSMLSLCIMTAIFLACGKDDGPSEQQPDPEPENQAPGAFSLLEVMDGETDIELLPTLTWNTSIDPDGDQVVYDVYLDTESDPEIKVATNLTATTFALSEKLDWALEYHWKVLAKDSKGGETTSTTFSFKSRMANVTRIETTIPFEQRDSHASVVFDDKMWVLGGSFVTGPKNDSWFSTNGVDWISTDTPARLPSKLRFHATSVLFDKIWLSGGIDENNMRSKEVWVSETGRHWDLITTPNNFPEIHDHSMVTFNNTLWILGGSTDNGRTSDIWSGTGSGNWSKQTLGSTVFAPRSRHASVVFQDKIWLVGGQGGSGQNNVSYNDVWQSADGTNWELVTDDAGFSNKYAHQLVVFDDKLWVIGGHNGTGSTNEIWYSKDGITWVDATPEDSFIPVLNHTSVVFDDKIWVLGGANNPEDNNLVWTIE